MKKTLLSLGIILGLGACATGGNQVLQRSDELTARPFWAKTSTQGYPCAYSESKDGYVKKAENAEYLCMVGYFSQPAEEDTDVSGILEDAEYDAKRKFATAINQKIASAYNRVSENNSVSSSQKQSSMTAFNKASLSSMTVVGNYWEKAIEPTNDGKRIMLRAYTQVAISKKAFERAMRGEKQLSEQAKALNKKTLDAVFEE